MTNIEYVTNEICLFYNLSLKDIKSKSRKREIVFPRQMAMAVCKNAFDKETLKSIGNYFGGRDHSTVIHACQTVDNLCSYDTKIKAEYETLLAQVKSRNISELPLDIKQMLLGICPVPRFQLEWAVNGKVIIEK